jgi:hemoglobin
VYHSWVTSWLFIGLCIALFAGAFGGIFKTLVNPLIFMKMPQSRLHTAGIIFYFVWLLAIIALLITSNVHLSQGYYEEYDKEIAIFFCCFGVFVFACWGMLVWTAACLVTGMRKVNRSYDRHAKHSAKQRKSLVRNTQRMVKSVAILCFIVGGISIAICAVYFSEAGTFGLASTIMWSFLMLGLISIGSIITLFFGRKYGFMRKQQTGSLNSYSSSTGNILGPRSQILAKHIPRQEPEEQTGPSHGHYYENAVAPENNQPFPDLVKAEGSIYQKIGGKPVIDKAVRIFYDKMLADQRVSHFFGEVSIPLLKKKQEMFMILVTGGPAVYTGQSLRQAHARLNLDEESFDIAAGYIRDSFVELGVEQCYIDVVIARVQLFKSEVLGLVGDCSAIAKS